MYDAEVTRMRELIRRRRYVMTLHAEDEMTADGLSIFDVESAILTGQISERQRDREPEEWKYLLTGEGLRGDSISVVARFSLTGKLIIITVYRE